MTDPVRIHAASTDIEALSTLQGRIALLVDSPDTLDVAARRVNRLTRGALARLLASDRFAKLKPAEAMTLAFPAGMEVEAVDVVRLPRRTDAVQARKAGVALAKLKGKAAVTVMAGGQRHAAELGLGLALRAYSYDAMKSPKDNGKDETAAGDVTLMVSKPDEVEAALVPLRATIEGVFLTRDLISAPANILTTTTFADQLLALRDLGVTVEVLEESDLEKLGMGSLLSVGHGSESPSKVVVMQWNGGAKDAAPLALVGKGVVFDTGGYSLKPAGGMEDMTMDMGGAGVVAGVMHTLARRGAKANVVGLVGLVENMISGRSTRPGDVVRSMKGDTIEVINTDAEGRLVLADVLWYAQDRFKPAGIVDLATLTGAIIIGLGHEKAGVFSNDDALCNAVLKAAEAEGEGAWRMPLGAAYDAKLKSAIADMKNVGGRDAGAITAAQFLQRFIKDETPWVHLDIAGVASVKEDTPYAPKGASGWGVMALNRLVADRFEG
ncbi:leucyl aminopeptidase [Seohaeicola sp. SP36]|uniref:leucyl aminopeptidase n=1 Tax=unclassified Seohaeicola TaxID=2641111 RepID=UPI00237BBCB4|nr:MULTISPECIES: leucyl aminopeptidase [unclassified Seohaeicola]MDD9706040.1 leucyl aminopeptidase [Seohaeicola sp. 4SK31]MDD9734499.1 leucyl aminopeptidase [Seohaeicola sp. SP36]